MIEAAKIVSREEWLVARKKLLAREKQWTHERDAIAAERRGLPWVRVEKNYIFDSPSGKRTLADLFEDKTQLIVYHFMFGPEWNEGCPSCSFNMDHIGGALVHLAQRDVSFVAISRARSANIEAFKKRLGWKFNWVSSYESDFNRDYAVSFTKEELAGGACYNFGTSGFPSEEAPGLSIFYKKGNDVFHTYSTYARGSETVLNTYNYLDLVPKGRDEEGLYLPMAWVRHHDRYEDGQLADATKPYWPAETASTKEVSTASCCSAEHA